MMPDTQRSRPVLPGASVLPPMDPDPPRPKQAEGASKKERSRGRHRGRFAVLNMFADEGARLVNTTAQACWWVLYRETKPDGIASVTHARIAECVGVSRLTVGRALRRLEEVRLMTVVRRGGLRTGAPSYRVHGTPRG